MTCDDAPIPGTRERVLTTAAANTRSGRQPFQPMAR
jgi:hypothetical protein